MAGIRSISNSGSSVKRSISVIAAGVSSLPPLSDTCSGRATDRMRFLTVSRAATGASRPSRSMWLPGFPDGSTRLSSPRASLSKRVSPWAVRQSQGFKLLDPEVPGAAVRQNAVAITTGRATSISSDAQSTSAHHTSSSLATSMKISIKDFKCHDQEHARLDRASGASRDLSW